MESRRGLDLASTNLRPPTAGDIDGAVLLAGLNSVLHGLAALPLCTTSRALVSPVVPRQRAADSDFDLLRQISAGVTMRSLA